MYCIYVFQVSFLMKYRSSSRCYLFCSLFLLLISVAAVSVGLYFGFQSQSEERKIAAAVASFPHVVSEQDERIPHVVSEEDERRYDKLRLEYSVQ